LEIPWKFPPLLLRFPFVIYYRFCFGKQRICRWWPKFRPRSGAAFSAVESVRYTRLLLLSTSSRLYVRKNTAWC
jgi:hypothetical protein